MSDYPVPCGLVEVTHEVKKSRFITRACFADSKDTAKLLVGQAKQDYPDARHHCWAYLFGNPACATQAGFSDDGEPSGTAGKPILNVLSHKGIGDVMVIVIRYFGGIKLGAGGLVRAYSAAAQLAMEDLAIDQKISCRRLRLICDFSQEQPVRHWLASLAGSLVDIQYQQQISMTIDIPKKSYKPFDDIMKGLGINILPL